MIRIKKRFLSGFTAVSALFIAAFIIITICSKCSPLYPLNDWDDANCFFTVGKSMMNGRILYKDIFEQKGPILYMLHGAAWIISHNSFLGIYLAEVISCFFYLYYSYKTIKLFRQDKTFMAAVIPMAAFVYTSLSFCSGDSAEEWCLPMLSFMVYTAIERVKNNKLLNMKQMVLCGICAGLILWIKFTMLGFVIGFAAAFVVLYLRKKEYKHILFCSIAMITGIIVSSLPVIIYFSVYDSFGYLWEVYFYDNMFLYSTGESLPPIIKQTANLLSGLLSFAAYNTFGFLTLIAGVYILIKMQNKTLLFVFLFIVICGFFFSFVGGRAYAYYSLSMSVFSPVGMIFITDCVRRFIKKKNIKASAGKIRNIVCIICIPAAFLMCRNTYLMFTNQEDMPQFRFNKIISAKKEVTLLNYGFLDGGFYTVSGIVPECRAFCGLNIELEELKETQDKYIQEKRADFIVTKDKCPVFKGYSCIDKCDFVYWTQTSTYYLYSKN